MKDSLDELAGSAAERIRSGYYEVEASGETGASSPSFVASLEGRGLDPVVAELKAGSPTQGDLFEADYDPEKLAELYLEGGAAGFSVLTDPDNFGGSLEDLGAAGGYGIPVLMKDFVLDRSQIEAGRRLGADAVLLIHRLFQRDRANFDLEGAISFAHELGLEVLLEVNDLGEYQGALETEAEMIGINNRDLRSLEVDLSTTEDVLAAAEKDRIVWSMSGVTDREDVNYLSGVGADAFLVGTSLSRAGDPVDHLRHLRGETLG